jgi:hypothetical protein
MANNKAFKPGQRVAIDVSYEACYRAEGIKFIYGIFIEMTEGTECAVKVDGEYHEEIREISNLSLA